MSLMLNKSIQRKTSGQRCQNFEVMPLRIHLRQFVTKNYSEVVPMQRLLSSGMSHHGYNAGNNEGWIVDNIQRDW